jgi:hypothetical protein
MRPLGHNAGRVEIRRILVLFAALALVASTTRAASKPSRSMISSAVSTLGPPATRIQS